VGKEDSSGFPCGDRPSVRLHPCKKEKIALEREFQLELSQLRTGLASFPQALRLKEGRNEIVVCDLNGRLTDGWLPRERNPGWEQAGVETDGVRSESLLDDNVLGGFDAGCLHCSRLLRLQRADFKVGVDIWPDLIGGHGPPSCLG